MAYREKDTKKWTAQWFETNVMGEKKKRRKRGFETKREALEFERSKKLSTERSMDMKLSDFFEIFFFDKKKEPKKQKNKKSGRQISQAIISKLFSEHPDIYPCQTIRKKLYLFSFYLYLIHFGYLYVYPRPF